MGSLLRSASRRPLNSRSFSVVRSLRRPRRTRRSRSSTPRPGLDPSVSHSGSRHPSHLGRKGRIRPGPDRLRQDHRLRVADCHASRSGRPGASARPDTRSYPRAGGPNRERDRSADGSSAPQTGGRVLRRGRFWSQLNALRHGVDVAVACPGRLADLVGRGALSLADVSIVVVDEADRMADMGFLPEVKRILDQVRPDRQTLLFSATLDGEVDVLVRRYQRSPVRVSVEADSQTSLSTTHEWVDTRREDRLALAAHYINCHGSTIVFCRTRRGADRVAKQLVAAGVTAVPIHGDRSQSQRDRALAAFSNGKAQALVATDVAARGIHVDSVRCVVHFDLAGTDKDYVHRSGRTGRAGADGVVVTLVTESDTATVRALQKALDHPISPRWGSRGLVQVRGRELAYTVGAGADGDTGPSSRRTSREPSGFERPARRPDRTAQPSSSGGGTPSSRATRSGRRRVALVLLLERTTSAPGADCLAGSGAGHRVASPARPTRPGPQRPPDLLALRPDWPENGTECTSKSKLGRPSLRWQEQPDAAASLDLHSG